MNATEHMHDRARMNEIIDGLRAWYKTAALPSPTPAQVENLICFCGERGIGLTSGEWSEIYKLGGDRIAALLNIACGHMRDDGGDEKVTAAAKLLAIRGRVRVIPRAHGCA